MSSKDWVKFGTDVKTRLGFCEIDCTNGLKELDKVHKSGLEIIDQLMFLTDKEALQKAVFEFHEAIGGLKEHLSDNQLAVRRAIQFVAEECFP